MPVSSLVKQTSQSSKKKLIRVFDDGQEKENIARLTASVKALYGFTESAKQFYERAVCRQERVMLHNMCKDMQRRIGKLADKAEKVSGFVKHKSELLKREKDKGMVRDEDLFNYEEYFAQQRDQQLFEKQMGELERKELEGLTDSLVELSQTFTRMQDLVFEQGAIIDRIDLNLSVTLDKVELGNIQLQKAIEHQEGGLADTCIKILAVLVVLMSLALLLKYL